MSGVLVRSYQPGEAEALGALMFAAVREGAAGHYTEAERRAWCPVAPSGPEWEARLSEAVTVVAEGDGAPLGFMTVDPARAYLDLAYVRPEAMGTGLADALYAVIEGRARAAGLAVLSTDASDTARSFFLRHGWTVLRRQAIERRGVTVHNSRMEKTLARQSRNDAA